MIGWHLCCSKQEVGIFFSLKGWDNLAQGNALGFEQSTTSLKGWDNDLLWPFVPALQAGISNHDKTQGVALGYVVPVLRTENELPPFSNEDEFKRCFLLSRSEE